MTIPDVIDYSKRAGNTPRPDAWIEPLDTFDHASLAAAASLTFHADISEFQPPVDSSYPYQMLSIRGDNGNRLDNHFTINWARANMYPGIKVVSVYVVFIPGALSGVLSRIKGVLGPTCPDKVVFRIDMESGAEFAGPGDHSAEANQWLVEFGQYGTTILRQDGYANSYDWASNWSSHPAPLKRITASYSSQDPGTYGWQYFGGMSQYPSLPGYPRACPPFGAWVDMNVIPQSIDQIMIDYGLTASPGPIPSPTEDEDDMKLFSHKGAIVLLFGSGQLKGVKSVFAVRAYQSNGVPGPKELDDAEFNSYHLMGLHLDLAADPNFQPTVFSDDDLTSLQASDPSKVATA